MYQHYLVFKFHEVIQKVEPFSDTKAASAPVCMVSK